jgi:hypothetical protein
MSCSGVIACDKREAFAQASVCDDRVRRSSTSEGGSNPAFCFAARWIASLALAMTVPEVNGCLTIESEEARGAYASTVVITRACG